VTAFPDHGFYRNHFKCGCVETFYRKTLSSFSLTLHSAGIRPIISPKVRNPDRHWYEQIPCREGAFISLYAEDPVPILRLHTPLVKGARAIFNQIRDVPGVRADFHFNDEAESYFPLELLHLVAELARARRKRQGRKLSVAEKTKLVEAGKAYRFRGNSAGRQTENLAQI
jgi:hypothetical protein